MGLWETSYPQSGRMGKVGRNKNDRTKVKQRYYRMGFLMKGLFFDNKNDDVFFFPTSSILYMYVCPEQGKKKNMFNKFVSIFKKDVTQKPQKYNIVITLKDGQQFFVLKDSKKSAVDKLNEIISRIE